jgi:hypothetical protein
MGENFVITRPVKTPTHTPALHALVSAFAFAFAATLAAQTAPSPPAAPAAPAAASTVKLEDFVVTGVFNATEAKKATTAITTLTADFLAERVALSADDLLLDVAGVFVNSSLGEIRGMVYSRGISADSSDGATGQYYVSMQEDGLPIANIAFGNYNASYFNSPDATLQRVDHVVQLPRRRLQLHQPRRPGASPHSARASLSSRPRRSETRVTNHARGACGPARHRAGQRTASRNAKPRRETRLV